MQKELEAALDLAETLPADKLPRLLGSLEEVRAVALMRLTTRVEKTEPDKLLTVRQVADRLAVSRDWVYRHGKTLPFFYENGSSRNLRFSAAKLDLYLKGKQK